jgi:hypothetical protein
VHLAFFAAICELKKAELDASSGVSWASKLPTCCRALTGQIDRLLHSEPTTTLAIVNKAGICSWAARGDMGRIRRRRP